MKCLMKIIIITIILILSSATLFSYTYATDDVIQGAQDFLDAGLSQTLDTTKVKRASDTIYNAFLAVGTIIVVIVGAILGLQFIFGSIEEKVKVQEALVPFVIGSVLIFGAFGIWKVVLIVLDSSL